MPEWLRGYAMRACAQAIGGTGEQGSSPHVAFAGLFSMLMGWSPRVCISLDRPVPASASDTCITVER
eukprot:15469951-Alexandrium_andersonii.AAC.1